jgi:hypothetical protein
LQLFNVLSPLVGCHLYKSKTQFLGRDLITPVLTSFDGQYRSLIFLKLPAVTDCVFPVIHRRFWSTPPSSLEEVF